MGRQWIEVADQPWCPTGVRDVVDLGAGAGGPWRARVGQLATAGVPVRVHLTDARARGVGIAVFEATRRDARALAFMLLVPRLVLLATPLLRPFRWSRLLLTYVLPAIPLVAVVDGMVSCLRTYTPDELRALAARVTTRGRPAKPGRARSR